MRPIIVALVLLCMPPAQAGWREYPVLGHRVIDGDTVEVTLDLLDTGTSAWRATVRLRIAGVDAPEVRAPSACERDLAARARVYTDQWLRDRAGALTARVLGGDKYGRAVGDIMASDGALSGALLAAGLARPYGASGLWC